MDSDRDTKDHPARGGVQATGIAEPCPHAHGGMGRPGGMVLTAEQQEQCVPPELEQVAAAPVGHAEQLLEAGVDGVGDLFGPHLAVTGQPFGHLGEPRDVPEHHGPLDLPPEGRILVGPVQARPVDGGPRDVGQQDRRRR